MSKLASISAVLLWSLRFFACGGSHHGADASLPDAGLDGHADGSDAGGDRLAAPELLSVDPDRGPASGGTRVVLTGRSFSSGATVRFGAVVAAELQLTSASQIEAVTPPGSAGPVSVRLTNPDGQYSQLEQAFTYTEPEAGDCPRETNCQAAMAEFSFHTGNPADSVKLAGEFTGWLDGAIPMQGDGQGDFTTAVRLREGRYEYKFVVNDSDWFADPEAGDPEPFFGNSVRLHDNPCTPNLVEPEPAYGEIFSLSLVTIGARYVDSDAAAGIDPDSICAVVDGQVQRAEYDPDSDRISVRLADLEDGDHRWFMSAADTEGHRSAEISGMFTIDVIGQAPVADGGHTIFAYPGEWVVLDGTWSRDPDGIAIGGYSWIQTDGAPVALEPQPVTPAEGYHCDWDCDFASDGQPPLTEALMGFSPPAAGTYRFELTVSDDDGSSHPAAAEVIALSGARGQVPRLRLAVSSSHGSVSLEAVGAPGASVRFLSDARNPAAVQLAPDDRTLLLRPQDLSADGAYFFYAVAEQGGAQGEPATALVRKQGGALDGSDFDSPPDWLPDAQIYEIYVRGFADSDGDGAGDFQGLVDKLDYLEDLGVDTLWLMPVFESADHAHGYHSMNYYRAERDYGNDTALVDLVRAAHERGMRIVLDLVINHVSRQHPMFQSATLQPGSRWRDHFIWFANRSGSDPLISQYGFGRELGGTRLTISSGWGDIPDVNFGNPVARQRFFEVAHYWMDPDGDGDFSDGVDGFRLDHVTGPAHRVWRNLRRELKARRPDLLLLAEVFRDFDNGGQGYGIKDYYPEFDLAFTFPFYWVAHGIFAGGEPAGGCAEPCGLDWLMAAIDERFADDAVMCFFVENHDVPWYSTVFETFGRSEGKLIAANALMQTLPNTPQLLYGQELGTTHWRGMMPWALDRPDNTLKAAFREQMLLRRDCEALRRGSYRRLDVTGGPAQDVFAFARTGEQETIVVVINTRGWPADAVEVDLAPLATSPAGIEDQLGKGSWQAVGGRLQARSLAAYERWIGVLEGE
ncbi:MAG: IPT/TIG domain-containing protein [Deltaproteobacteria bacterium]|nr:IPT/TIG domain-containing protein [Deltaproteobacteria bacterium]